MIRRIGYNRMGSEQLTHREALARDLTSRHIKPMKAKKSRHIGRWIAIGIVVVVIGVAGFFGYKAYGISKRIFAKSDDKPSVFDQIKLLTNADSARIKGEDEDRINILLIGAAASGFSGAGLSDTNIIMSVKPSTQQVSMISIPRDLWVKIPGYGYNKLNAAHAFGERDNGLDGGPALEKQVIKNVTGLDIHYWARIDFNGFENVIDAVGGIDVPIEKGFYDFLHKQRFDAGVEHMNGKRALAYVRARYVVGPEGTDFARARRQQQVIKLVRDKVISSGRPTDAVAIASALNQFSAFIRTDMTPAELKHLFDLVKDIPDDKIINKVVDYQSGLVKGGQEQVGSVLASVVLPIDPSFKKIHDFAANIFNVATEPATGSNTGTLESEAATIEVQNGSGIAQAAAKTANKLPFKAAKVTTAARSDFATTVIYDYTEGKKPTSLAKLQELLGVTVTPLPDDLESQKKIRLSGTADFVIIVGRDYASKL